MELEMTKSELKTAKEKYNREYEKATEAKVVHPVSKLLRDANYDYTTPEVKAVNDIIYSQGYIHTAKTMIKRIDKALEVLKSFLTTTDTQALTTMRGEAVKYAQIN